MNYYILTQGTKSQDFSFIIKNGQVIEPDNNLRNSIHKLFEKVDNNGVKISKKNSNINIIKYQNNYLIETLTTNTDKLKRKIPVELLLENFKNDEFSKKDLVKIQTILKNETVLVDETDWENILFQLENDLKKFQQKKNIKIISGISLTIIAIFITLKYLLKWI